MEKNSWKIASKDIELILSYKGRMMKMAEYFDMYFDSEISIGKDMCFLNCKLESNEPNNREDN